MPLPDAFKLRAAQSAFYARQWWSHDPVVDDLCRRTPGMRMRLERIEAERGEVTTQDVYATVALDPQWPSDWLDDRAALDRRLLAALPSVQSLRGASPSVRNAYITLGLPGSGKTQSLRGIAWAHYSSFLSVPDRSRAKDGVPAGAAVLDADEIRILFAEYAEGLGSGVVQPETAAVAYGPRWEALLAGLPFALLLDTVGSRTDLPVMVDLLMAAQYDVHLLLASVDVEVALERVVERCLTSGRLVSLSYVRSKAGVPEAALEDVVHSGRPLAGWGVWDTTQQPALRVQGAGAFAAT